MLNEHYEATIRESIRQLYLLKNGYEQEGGDFTITDHTSSKTMNFIASYPEYVNRRGSFKVYDNELLVEIKNQIAEFNTILVISYPAADEMVLYTVHLPEEAEEELDSKGGSGCFIATAVYDSYDAPEVMILRQFRDQILSKSFPGRAFIKTYYTLSPRIAQTIARQTISKSIVKQLLISPLVRFASTVLSSHE